MATQSWLLQIDQLTQEFQTAFQALSIEQLNMRPDANTWSIAQNIDHLMVINQTYEPIIAALQEGTLVLPFHARISFIVKQLGKFILQSVQPDRRTKIKTFPIWQPAASDLPEGIVHRFVQHQAALKELIKSCEPHLQRNAVIYSPANKNIVYTLATAFDIMVTHERRHLEQAKELLTFV